MLLKWWHFKFSAKSEVNRLPFLYFVSQSVLFEMFNRVGPVASIRVCRDSVSHVVLIP